MKNLLNSSIAIHNYKIIYSHMLKQETSTDKMLYNLLSMNSSILIHNYKIIFSRMLKQETSADKM